MPDVDPQLSVKNDYFEFFANWLSQKRLNWVLKGSRTVSDGRILADQRHPVRFSLHVIQRVFPVVFWGLKFE